MALKPKGMQWKIMEQIIEDLPTGLTFQFAVVDDPDGPFRLRIYGDVPFGNREIIFGAGGERTGGGTATAGACRPSWLQEII
jgi:hypothetical protein